MRLQGVDGMQFEAMEGMSQVSRGFIAMVRDIVAFVVIIRAARFSVLTIPVAALHCRCEFLFEAYDQIKVFCKTVRRSLFVLL